MAECKHFSHPHNLSFHKSLEGEQLTCTGCNFPCIGTGTPIYSCSPCKFFLHEQCFNANRSLIHPSHPDHPLSLFPSPTYMNSDFLCNLCNKSGTGFCFCCTTCEFDVHVHCAYDNDLKPKPKLILPPNQIQLKAHPSHPLHYLSKSPYVDDSGWCNVCGTDCDQDDPLYNCDICGYDAHVGCVNLQETVGRDDHKHKLSLLHVNPYESFECDVCKGMILQDCSMYLCRSGCDYGMHVKCVSAPAPTPVVASALASVKVAEKTPMTSDMQFQVQMFKLQNQMRVQQMLYDTNLLANRGFYRL